MFCAVCAVPSDEGKGRSLELELQTIVSGHGVLVGIKLRSSGWLSHLSSPDTEFLIIQLAPPQLLGYKHWPTWPVYGRD